MAWTLPPGWCPGATAYEVFAAPSGASGAWRRARGTRSRATRAPRCGAYAHRVRALNHLGASPFTPEALVVAAGAPSCSRPLTTGPRPTGPIAPLRVERGIKAPEPRPSWAAGRCARVHPRARGEHVLDVETLWLSHEVPGGWDARHALRVSCAVLHDVAQGRDLVFAAEPVPGSVPGTRPLEGLYHFLEACRSEGCTLVGHNIRAFDWEVLAGEFEARGLVGHRGAWGPAAARLLDTMATLQARLGWRPSLEALALHNLGEAKSMPSALAPALWRRGERREVIAYCRRDVDLTRRLWLKGRAERRLAVQRFPDGSLRWVEVDW